MISKIVYRLFVVFFVTSFAWGCSVSEHPEFDQYEVAKSDLKLEVVDLYSHPQGPYFKTRLLELKGRIPNFAGNKQLVYWGCGSSCQMLAVIDHESGLVDIPEDLIATNGYCFKTDSRLLIVNPAWENDEDSFPLPFKTAFYEWTEDGFRLLKESDPVYMGKECSL